MSVVNFRIAKRSVGLGDKMMPPFGPNEVQGKRVTARGIVSFLGEGGEFIVVLFLTEDSGVSPATTFATPPTCLLYLPPHLLNSWLATLQIAPPTMGSIDFDDPEQTFVGPLPS